MLRQYATQLDAADPRPGPTRIRFSRAYLMRSQTTRKYAGKPMSSMTPSS